MNSLVETVFEKELTKKGLEDLRVKYPEDLKVDMSDDAEFKAARKTRTEKNKLVEAINRKRIDFTTELKNYSDGIIDTIGNIYDVVTLPFESENERRQAEAEKAAKEKQALLDLELAQIKDIASFYDSATGKSSGEISDIIESVDLIEVDHFDKELIHEAMDVKKSTLEKLDALLSDTKNREILNAEREKLAEEAEAAAKKAVIIDRLNTLKMIPTTMFGKSSEDIGKKILSIKSFSITVEEFGDFADEGKNAVTTVISQLETMESQQKTVEEAEELKQQQAQQRAIDEQSEAAKKREQELAEHKVIDQEYEHLEESESIEAEHLDSLLQRDKTLSIVYYTHIDPGNPQPEEDLPFTSVDDHLETKEDILRVAAIDWWEEHGHTLGLYTPKEIASEAFRGGAEFATLGETDF